MSRKEKKKAQVEAEEVKAAEAEAVEAAEPAEPAASVEPAEVVEVPEAAEAAEPVETEVYETSEEFLREAGRAEPLKPKRGIPDTVRMGGSLLIICAVVALVVSFVNSITVNIIAEAAAREKREAIERIFGEGMAITEADPLEGTNAVYAVADGAAGYCVSLYAKGFGGNIDMMVGVAADGTIQGVEIVSHSETPGFGARADDPEYLGQYIGQGSGLVLREEIDALSGATISSKAVLAGVNAATAALVEAGLVPEVKVQVEPEAELEDEFGFYEEIYDFEWEDSFDGGEGE